MVDEGPPVGLSGAEVHWPPRGARLVLPFSVVARSVVPWSVVTAGVGAGADAPLVLLLRPFVDCLGPRAQGVRNWWLPDAGSDAYLG